MMIATQLIQNIMLLLVTYILIINNVMCLTMERGTTKHHPRSGEDAVSNVKDDITSSSSRPLCSCNYTVNEQKEFNCQSMASVRAVYAKYSTIQECMTLERSQIQLNEETLIVGFINRIQELEGNVYQLKDEKETNIHKNEAQIKTLKNNLKSVEGSYHNEKMQHYREMDSKNFVIEYLIVEERKHKEETEKLKGEIQTKDSVIEEYIRKERKYKEETENFKRELETKDSLIEENIGKERTCKEETDVITHGNEAKIQALQNSIKSLQEGHQIVKEKLKGEIQTKDSVIEEYIGKERKYKEETEKLKGEIQTKDSLIEELNGQERTCNEETDVITHENEAKIQALQNNIKSLQEGHQIVKENLKAEIQNKDSLIEEYIAKERKCKEENEESLEKENRDLQNQIKSLKIQVTDKESKLQQYLPQNKEGTWSKYSGGVFQGNGVVSHEGHQVYVCRAEVDGDVVPGWLWPSRVVCHVFHNGKEHNRSPYEVLVPSYSFEWIGSHGDEIRPRAVPGGQTKEGEVLYVGRVKNSDGWYRVGKVQPSLKGCYNWPHVNGDYTINRNYEILAWK